MVGRPSFLLGLIFAHVRGRLGLGVVPLRLTKEPMNRIYLSLEESAPK